MQRSKRLQEMVLLVHEHKYMSVKELSTYFLVSEVTIRAELTELEKSGQIVRKQGGQSSRIQLKPLRITGLSKMK